MVRIVREDIICTWIGGFYYKQLKKVNAYFKKEQIKILLYDDLKNNKKNVIDECFLFLGLEGCQDSGIVEVHNKSSVARSDAISRLMNESNGLRRIAKLFISPKYRRVIKYTIRNKNRKSYKYSEISSVTKDKLMNYYYDDICMLEKEYFIDLKHWKNR